jgi:hypothetical protein
MVRRAKDKNSFTATFYAKLAYSLMILSCPVISIHVSLQGEAKSHNPHTHTPFEERKSRDNNTKLV